MENEKLGMEVLEKLGVSGGAFSDLTTKEKLAIAALCVGSAAVGAGAGVLGTNKYQTGNWLGKGKGEEKEEEIEEEMYIVTKKGPRKASAEELKNEKLKGLLAPKSFVEAAKKYNEAAMKVDESLLPES